MKYLRIKLVNLILGNLSYIKNVNILADKVDIEPFLGEHLHIDGKCFIGKKD